MRSFTADQLKKATEILGIANPYQLRQLLTRKGEISFSERLMIRFFEEFVDPHYIFELASTDKRSKRIDWIKIYKTRHYDEDLDRYIEAFLLSHSTNDSSWKKVQFITSPIELVKSVEDSGFYWDGLLLRHEFDLDSQVPLPENEKITTYRVLIHWLSSNPQESPIEFRCAWATNHQGVVKEFKTYKEAEKYSKELYSGIDGRMFYSQPLVCHLSGGGHRFWCMKSWPKDELEREL